MKKIKLVLKTALFCLAAVLSMGIAQAQSYWTTNWVNDNAPFGTNGNLINNWSFELPGTVKIQSGFDTVPYWFSDEAGFTGNDSGIQGGTIPANSNVEDSYDGTWDAFTRADQGFHARQTTGYVIQQGDCFLVSVASKGEWINDVNWTKIDGYLSVMLYYGGTADVVVGGANQTVGTVGTPFFTNTFVIHPAPGGGSHTTHTDWTNYFFGVITNSIPTNAIGHIIGIDVWQSTTQYNANADGAQCWLDFDGVVLIPTNGIPPIAAPVVLTPTNSVWGGDTLTFSENCFGSLPMAYQWQTDGGSGGAMNDIDGATLTNLVVTAPTTPGTNKYQVIMTNNNGSVTSAVVFYVVRGLAAPAITQDTGTAEFGPITNLFAFIGGNVDLYAASDGAPTITNQWDINTGSGYVTIAGATNYLRVLTNVQTSADGYYLLGATNAIGSSNSTPAYLTALVVPAAPSSNGTTNMYAYCVYTNHPWAYWRFEETTNTLTNSMQAYDYSGHNFDATYGNSDGTSGAGCKDGGESLAAGIYGPGHGDNLSGFPSRNGCATLANGKNNGCLTAPPLNLNTNTVTFTMWIYINPNDNLITAYTGLLMNRNGSDAAGIGFGGNVTTNDYGVTGVSIAELGYTWNSNSASTYGWHSGLYPAVSTWNFVACTITPSNTTMYLYFVGQDAQLNTVTNLFKAAHTVTNAVEAFSGGRTWIGSDNYNNGNTFDGYIDEVAVFTNALTEAQIQDLYLRSLGLVTGIAPVFTAQPTNTTIFQNQTLTLTATASGVPSPWYQWQYESGTTWSSMGSSASIMPNASTLVYSNWTSTSVTNFRCTATNLYGAATSSVAVVTTLPIVNYNKGLWTVNFAVATTSHGGPGTPYVGRGLLGTNTYWNALGGNPFENATSLRDDGSTHSGVMIGVTNASVGTFSSLGDDSPMDNALLDQYAQIVDTVNGMNFFFTQVPNGRYNLALYGCTAAYADRGAGFTVYTNGVSAGTQWITNKQDTYFLPYDNAVVYTNLVVTNGMLQVNESIALATPAHTSSTEADFNGAQLELITYGPNVLSLTNSGTNLVLTYAGGFVLQSTNVTGPWTTNTTVGAGAVTINPTGQLKFYRVWTNKAF